MCISIVLLNVLTSPCHLERKIYCKYCSTREAICHYLSLPYLDALNMT